MSEVSTILGASLEVLACPELIYYPITLNNDPSLHLKRMGMPSTPTSPMNLSVPPTTALSPPNKTEKKSNRKASISPDAKPDSKPKAHQPSKGRSVSTKSRPSSKEGIQGTPASKCDLVLATNIHDRYQHLIQMAHSQGNRESVKSAEAATLRNRHGASFAKGAINKGGNHSGVHDFGFESVRNEVFMKTYTDTDEVHSWIQWALAASEGIGLGFMGLQGAVDYEESSVHSAEFYREVKSHLHDAERMIHPDDISSQLSLSCVLMKVSAQLNLRKEAGSYVEQYEKCADRLQDVNHQALSKKYRYDFEEWNTFVKEGGITTKLRRFSLLLGYAKSYYRAAEKTADLQLQRDAIKRVLNIYIEIAQASELSGTRVEADLQDEIDLLAADDIDQKESTDINWMRKYSRTRAAEFLRKLKEKRLISPDEGHTGPLDDGEEGVNSKSEGLPSYLGWQ